ncbi:CBL-interacting protein kinase 18 [Platanthera zijinensis]|uniref:non-specific serine/threonine protein kinase n=1 Tax=Platanthera zijinensis TaxID=2320716 RepID=A0AAP0B477_9ASPA
MENKGCLLQKYELGRLLGQGTFAKVYYARSITTSQSVAIKMIDKEKVLKVGLMDQIKREISVMRLVQHPNIVQLYEVMATKTKIYFVMEYIKGGELFDRIAKGRLAEEVSDFGLSALAESKRQDGLLHTTCGTPAYVAPEVISRNGYNGAKADIWSCGVILYVLLAGYLPFRDSNLMEMYRKIEKAEFRCPSWFPSEAKKLLGKILDPNPSTRISIAKIMAHPWVKKGLNEPKELISADLSSNCQAERNQDNMKATSMNAFDIISLSAGFDLSGLFVDPDHRKEARFTSPQPAEAIISKIEEVAGSLRFKVQKMEGGIMKMERDKGRKGGVLGIDAEIFEITPSFHMVEVKMTRGDTTEFEKLWKEDFRPALKDIIWTCQGE